jgi:hypothetical protein
MLKKRVERANKTTGRGLAAMVGIIGAVLAIPSMAAAVTITFDDLKAGHGSVINGVPGVKIVADNFSRAFDYAVLFDSEMTGTADADLEAFFSGTQRWSGGNLVGEQLDLMLILQENLLGCDTGTCKSPDDEGNRPAGTLSFLFEVPILTFGFDLIDIDSLVSENGSITFNDIKGGSATIDFKTLLDGLEIGNNTANRIESLVAEELGLAPVDEVVFTMAGSAALDNLTFKFAAVPEPSTAALIGLGLVGLAYAGRRP